MGDKEADLTKDTTMAATTDFLRIVKGGSSRQISPSNFVDNVLTDLLETEGFIKSVAGRYRPVVNKTFTDDNPVTLEVSTYDTVLINTTDGDVTVNLPAALTCYDPTTASGYTFTIKKTVDANSIIITPNGSETIDGDATLTLSTTKTFTTLISNGLSWHIIGG